jgi:hypothetical protein
MTTNPDTLYVAAAVYFPGPPAHISYYLFAVNIATTTHTSASVPSIVISGTVNGNPPANASGKAANVLPTTRQLAPLVSTGITFSVRVCC